MKTPAIIAVVIISLIAGLAGGYAGSELNNEVDLVNSDNRVERIINSQADLISSIAEDVSPSVVSIRVTVESQSLFGRTIENEGAGTGIVVSNDGVIMTNRHVIPEGATQIEVMLSDGTMYTDIDVIGRDPRGGVDLAFIKVNGVDNLVSADIGNSDDVRVGDGVVAIGNALGEFQNSVTTGIISGRSRPITASDGSTSESLANLLQTDAAINPGNSGGPLLNMMGQVIGINTAVARGENIGFAIAVSDIRPVLDTVLESGEYVVPYVGVRYETLNPESAERNELDVDQGAYIRGSESFPAVLEDSPASKAGLRDGDVIVAVNGTELTETNPFGIVIGRQKVGDTLTFTIIRDGQVEDLEVTLEQAPESF